MRMLLHRAGVILDRAISGVIERGEMNSGKVLVRHDVSQPPEDPNEPNRTDPEIEEFTVGALIHWITAKTIARGFTRFQEGDAIVTFSPEQCLNSLRGVTFILPDGKEYVQSNEGTDDLAEFWDSMVNGRRLAITLLLRSRKVAPTAVD